MLTLFCDILVIMTKIFSYTLNRECTQIFSSVIKKSLCIATEWPLEIVVWQSEKCIVIESYYVLLSFINAVISKPLAPSMDIFKFFHSFISCDQPLENCVREIKFYRRRLDLTLKRHKALKLSAAVFITTVKKKNL